MPIQNVCVGVLSDAGGIILLTYYFYYCNCGSYYLFEAIMLLENPAKLTLVLVETCEIFHY